MEIENVVVGLLETNCYIISHGNECLIIDPGDDADKIKQVVNKKKVRGILITHHHFDHIGALEILQKFYKVEIYDFYHLKEGSYQIGSFLFDMILTPGHKEDSVSFLFGKNMFVGDFVFKGTVGRTDLEGGNFSKMQQSIQKLKTYSNDIRLYPGHGEATTLGEEKQYNSFF